MSGNDNLILVTGATGYIGARLVPRLLEAGYPVRVLARDPDRLHGRPWIAAVEVATGDVLKPETLPTALAGVSAAYYLIHSMSASGDFHERDLVAARIIYLSGLGKESDKDLSEHLSSRHADGQHDALLHGVRLRADGRAADGVVRRGAGGCVPFQTNCS